MKRKQPLEAVESTANTAANPLADTAADYMVEARRRGAEFAADAYERMQPALREARKRSAKVAADAFDRMHPAIDDALERVTPAVDTAVRRMRPVVDETLGKVPPAVDVARAKLQHEYLPMVAAALYSAAELVKEEEPEPAKRRGVVKTLGLIALAGAVLAGLVYAVRQLLAPPDSGWQTHEPSRPYVADPVADVVDKAKDAAGQAGDTLADVAADVQEKAADVVDAAKDAAGDLADAAKDAAAKATDATGDAVDDLKDKAGDLADSAKEAADGAKDAAADAVDEVKDVAGKAKDSAEKAVKDGKGDASPLAEGPYGEGSYVGAEPPEGYAIKGNERSMKYHLQGSGGYDRTITDVWFSSTDAAERAGFVRAQR